MFFRLSLLSSPFLLLSNLEIFQFWVYCFSGRKYMSCFDMHHALGLLGRTDLHILESTEIKKSVVLPFTVYSSISKITIGSLLSISQIKLWIALIQSAITRNYHRTGRINNSTSQTTLNEIKCLTKWSSRGSKIFKLNTWLCSFIVVTHLWRVRIWLR